MRQQSFEFGPECDLPTDRELIVDLFAGGGGASCGIEQATGYSPDIAVNHDADAVAMHYMNHPETRHYREGIWDVDPVKACGGRPVGLMWTSPDCCHFSRAKSGTPLKQSIRGLAWVTLRWAALVRPRVIVLENVVEFEQWGPLTRKRGRKNHPKPQKHPCLIQTGYGERDGQKPRALDHQQPLGTIVAGGIKHAVATPYLTAFYGPNGGADGCRGDGPEAPLPTQPTANRFGAVIPWLVRNWGGMTGQQIEQPYPTITTKGCQDMVGTATIGPETIKPASGLTRFLKKHDLPSVFEIGGQSFQLVDIGLRMLTPEELYRAQGFPDSYQTTHGSHGRELAKSARVRLVGNSVPPDVARAIVSANYQEN